MYRFTKKELLYKKILKDEKNCYFCNPQSKVLVEKEDNFYIMGNNFPYDIWDYSKVSTHLMLVPKKHIKNLEAFSKDLLEEYIKMLQKYSKKGYDIFTRAPTSLIKTQPHFHTHLIKSSGKIVKKINYNAKPYKLVVGYK